MIEEVEAGNVSTIIVKDMSRFGRDYLKVGFFTEVLFSEKDVRLIAVNDNIDTERGENDFAPMMNIFNEWFVRSMRQHKRRSPRYGNPGLFSGVAYCSDCGSKLYFHTRAIKNKWGTRHEGSYSCSEYRKDVQYQEGRRCTCHYTNETALTQLVLEELRDLLRYIPKHEKQFASVVMDRSAQEYKRETAAKKRAAEKHRRRIAELDTLIERLYVDNVSGKITDERYEKMSTKFEAEQAELIETVDRLALKGLC